MSGANFAYDRKSAAELGEVAVIGTYTVRTGRTADGLVIDGPINVTDPAADFVLTVPSGTFIGQQVLIVMSANTNSKTATITVTNHANADAGTAALDAVDEAMLLIWTGTEWDTVMFSTGADIA
jgi:hypothetical protein